LPLPWFRRKQRQSSATIATPFTELAPEKLPLEKEALIFRTVQESLRNVVKHANADHVTVRIAVDDGLATAEVADDGRGFTPNGSADREHMGLGLLSDLAQEAGGRLNVSSAPGEGTKVRLEVPA